MRESGVLFVTYAHVRVLKVNVDRWHTHITCERCLTYFTLSKESVRSENATFAQGYFNHSKITN